MKSITLSQTLVLRCRLEEGRFIHHSNAGHCIAIIPIYLPICCIGIALNDYTSSLFLVDCYWGKRVFWTMAMSRFLNYLCNFHSYDIDKRVFQSRWVSKQKTSLKVWFTPQEIPFNFITERDQEKKEKNIYTCLLGKQLWRANQVSKPNSKCVKLELSHVFTKLNDLNTTSIYNRLPVVAGCFLQCTVSIHRCCKDFCIPSLMHGANATQTFPVAEMYQPLIVIRDELLLSKAI